MRKKSLYLPKKYFAIILILPFFCLLFGWMSFSWVQGVREIGIPIQIKEEPFFCGKKQLESHCRFFMQQEGLRVQYFLKVGSWVVPKFLLGFKKGALEFCGSFIEAFSPSLVFAEDIPKQGPNKGNNDSRDKPRNVTIEDHLRSFTLGIVSAGFVAAFIAYLLLRRP